MKLSIKKEYLEWSIGGGRLKTFKLKNLPKSEYQKYYDLGFSEFFEVVKKKSKFQERLQELEEENKIDIQENDKD